MHGINVRFAITDLVTIDTPRPRGIPKETTPDARCTRLRTRTRILTLNTRKSAWPFHQVKLDTRDSPCKGLVRFRPIPFEEIRPRSTRAFLPPKTKHRDLVLFIFINISPIINIIFVSCIRLRARYQRGLLLSKTLNRFPSCYYARKIK